MVEQLCLRRIGQQGYIDGERLRQRTMSSARCFGQAEQVGEGESE